MNEGPDNRDHGTQEQGNPDHEREQAPGRPAVSQENLREQEEEVSEGPGDRIRRILRRVLRR